MLAGEVTPPGVFLRAAEVLRRQLFAFCLDDWVGSGIPASLPDETSRALDAMDRQDPIASPTFPGPCANARARLFQAFIQFLGQDLKMPAHQVARLHGGPVDTDGVRPLLKSFEELLKERRSYKKRKDDLDKPSRKLNSNPRTRPTKAEIDSLLRERDTVLELIKEINSRDLLNTLTDAGLIPQLCVSRGGYRVEIRPLAQAWHSMNLAKARM